MHKSTPWRLPTILHADWSFRPRTAFRRWTQAVHQLAAIQVGRHRFLAYPYRFLAYPYRFLAAKRQAKAGLSSGHSHDRTAFESFAPDISEQPDPNLTNLFDTRNHGSQRLSARYQHTRDVVVTRTHTHTTRDKGTKARIVPRRPAVRPNKHCCCCIVTTCGVVFFYPESRELFL